MDGVPVDRMFRAFSDPTRLRILHLLAAGELCVGDIVTVLKVPQPTASRHLGYLRRARLISARKKSYWTFYGLTSPRSSFHRKLLECLKSCFRDVPELARDSERLKRVRTRGGCCPT